MAELVVAMGILVLMLSLAGQVFNFTVKSTGQATALVEVSQLLRGFENAIRDDLRNVTPGQTVMVIQGNPVNAYWTRGGKEADDDGKPETGYPHVSDPERERSLSGGGLVLVHPRADMLMFFTGRKSASYVDPTVTSTLQQVVYGHAELGEYVLKNGVTEADPAPYEFHGIIEDPTNPGIFPVGANGYPSTQKVCRVPTEDWHLARRSVLIVPNYVPQANPPGANVIVNPITNLNDTRLLEGATDIITRFIDRPFDYEAHVLTPDPSRGVAEWYLPPIFDVTPGAATPYARSRLDVTPPPRYATRLGHYMLPNCASFKVEWTMDPRGEAVAGRLDGSTEVFWIDPGFMVDPTMPTIEDDDPFEAIETEIERLEQVEETGAEREVREAATKQLRRLDSLLNDHAAEHPNGRRYSLTDRFYNDGGDQDQWAPFSEGRANTHVFLARHVRFSGGVPEPVAEDVFPSALRITVDVFDAARRLERPVRHVMVVPIGE